MLKAANWSSYQSYKDRKPPWIRMHKTLLDNYEFQSMSADARALLPMLWLLASEHDDPTSGIIDSTVEKISFRLRISKDVIESSINEIVSAGFFSMYPIRNETVTEKEPARISNVTPETETETEAETDKPNGFVKPSTKISPCPYEKIVDKYHDILPMMRRVQILSDKRKRTISARWKEYPDIDEWDEYFRLVARSDFLCGRSEPTNGRKQFCADFDWIMNPTNMVNILEGKYHA